MASTKPKMFFKVNVQKLKVELLFHFSSCIVTFCHLSTSEGHETAHNAKGKHFAEEKVFVALNYKRTCVVEDVIKMGVPLSE